MNRWKTMIGKYATALKLFGAFIIVKIIGYRLINKNIWLISEKTAEARDNGYHLFIYLRENHPHLPVYYVIKKESPDFSKISKYGNIVFANTFKHFIYYLCARHSICSQGGGAAPEPKSVVLKFRCLSRADQDLVFLQHGVIYNEIPHGFDYVNTHYSLFVCSSSIEKRFIEKTYSYPEGVVKNVGLCRFDNLHHNEHKVKKQILFMPTFRKWLISSKIPDEALKTEKDRFMTSEYYQNCRELLQNQKLQDHLRSVGYVMVFYPHYAMQSYISCFSEFQSDIVTIADRWHYDVQNLLIESACLITDYSSIFFDFAYMEKPEIFYQFDQTKFRENHYKKGYFDYQVDGFGPVFRDQDSVVDYLVKTIKQDCKIERKYLQRIESFFDRRDAHNCKRTYDAIMKLENE